MTQDQPATSRGWQTWGVRLLPVLTFLVGLGLGLVVMAATGGSDPSAPEAEPSPTPTATSDPADDDTVVVVPAACEAAAENISEATRLLDDVAGSVRDFEPQELVDLLNRLEDLDRETRSLARDCSEVSVDEGASPSETPDPTETEEPTG